MKWSTALLLVGTGATGGCQFAALVPPMPGRASWGGFVVSVVFIALMLLIARFESREHHDP